MAHTLTSRIEADHAKAWNKVNDNYEELFALFDEMNGTSPQKPAPVRETVVEEQALKALDEAFPPPLKTHTPKATNRRHEKS